VSKSQQIDPRIHRVIAVTKASVARSQLETAMQLWFDDADPVSIRENHRRQSQQGWLELGLHLSD
jgi:hypothetical protein